MLTLHHLRIGRSVFTAWLLEELGVDYALEIYDRDPETRRSPPELKRIHPLGKSPIIDDDGLILAESGAIAAYLIERHDHDGALAPPRSDIPARARYEQWLHYAEGSAFAPLLMKLLLTVETGDAPVIRAFADGECGLHLDYIADQLGGAAFLLGDRLQGPDFGVSYALSLADRLGLLDGRPTLSAYLARLTERPAFQRAVARTGG